jgi:hypothetical protein
MLGKCTIKAWHFVAVESDAVIGCVIESIKPLKTKTTPCKWPLKPISKGRHREIISKGITVFCNANGIKEVVCHARDNAVPFI